MEGWGSSRCEKAARGLVVPLDISRYCRHRRSMLAGRGAVQPPRPWCSSCSLVSDLLREQRWGRLSSDASAGIPQP